MLAGASYCSEEFTYFHFQGNSKDRHSFHFEEKTQKLNSTFKVTELTITATSYQRALNPGLWLYGSDSW